MAYLGTQLRHDCETPGPCPLSLRSRCLFHAGVCVSHPLLLPFCTLWSCLSCAAAAGERMAHGHVLVCCCSLALSHLPCSPCVPPPFHAVHRPGALTKKMCEYIRSAVLPAIANFVSIVAPASSWPVTQKAEVFTQLLHAVVAFFDNTPSSLNKRVRCPPLVKSFSPWPCPVPLRTRLCAIGPLCSRPLFCCLQSAGKCLEVMGQHMHLGGTVVVPPVPVR
jgi:hypothetical protein